jgi:hypothetical protein
VKWNPLYLPLDGPDTEHSRVNEFKIFNSFQTDILAVDSFEDYTSNLQLSKLNDSQFL